MRELNTKTVSGTEDRRDDSAHWIANAKDEILVTGANGFIGVRVVRQLLEYGFKRVRCFVRQSSRVEGLGNLARQFPDCAIELVTGNLLTPADCLSASRDVSIVYHLAAGNEKSFAGAFMNSALATRNLVDAFLNVGKPKRFVNVSSFAVYSNRNIRRGGLVDETCSLEDAPQERFDAYGFGKLKQEQLIKEYGIKNKLPYVIVRPGAVFGPGKGELSGRIGVSTFGVFIHLGGRNRLPLTFVDNCADAIVLAGLTAGIDGEVFNIVDDELLTSAQFLRAYKKVKSLRALRIPYIAAYGLCFLWERYSKFSTGQIPAVFNRRRCAAEWKSMRYSNSKLKERVGWKPRVPMNQAMEAFLAQFNLNGKS
jgi:nucleoside-diphosphate-sugar epimerase